MGLHNNNCALGGFIFGILLIVSIILFAVSWDALDSNEMGLDWNKNTHKIGDLKEPGRYLIGLGHKFISFPTDLISIEFTKENENLLMARSFDGLKLTMGVTFQYRLNKDEESVKALFAKFGSDYDDEFQTYARSSMRDTASRYEAFAYFQNRSTIATEMKNDLDAQLSQFGAKVESFQLVDISLPEEFGNAVEQTELAKQAIEVAENKKKSLKVTGQTRVEQAQKKAIEVEQAANATAKAIASKGVSEAESIQYAIETETRSFLALKQNLNMTTTELLDYIYVKNIGESTATMRIRLDIPVGLQGDVKV